MPLTEDQLLERFNSRTSPTGALFKSKVLALRTEDGFVRMSYDIGPEYCNPYRQIQGGIISAMLDDACAMSAIVRSGKPIFVPTLELKTSFFAPAPAGLIFAEARCLKLGRSIAFMEADLLDADRKLYARISVTAAPRLVEAKPNLIETGDSDAKR